MMRQWLALLALFVGIVSCEQQVLSMDDMKIDLDVTDNASVRGALRRFTGDVRQVLAVAEVRSVSHPYKLDTPRNKNGERNRE